MYKNLKERFRVYKMSRINGAPSNIKLEKKDYRSINEPDKRREIAD